MHGAGGETLSPMEWRTMTSGANRKNRQVLIGLLVVVAALVTLVQFGLSSSEIYSVGPDELLTRAPEFLGRDLRLVGIVKDGSVDKDLSKTRLDFHVTKSAEPELTEPIAPEFVAVTYIGTAVPDTFQEGAEVVVEGTYDGRVFRATNIMAKCPSKYEAAPVQEHPDSIPLDYSSKQVS